MDDLLAEFITETNEGLSQLDVALVQLERMPGHAPTLSLVFRMVHTIKGTCGFLGLPRLERVAHAAEDVLVRLRDGELTATADIITSVLMMVDRIREIVAHIAATQTEPAGDDAPLIAHLYAVAGQPDSAADAAATIAALDAAPAPITPAPIAAPAAAVSLAVAAVATAAPGVEPADSNRSLRVAVDVLENLMTLVSELVLTRNQLLQLARRQKPGGQADPEPTEMYTVPLQRLSQITSDLQEGVMKTRLQPVGIAWNKLPRLVRDLAQELGKRIDLQMTGAETELDRQVLEMIRDPLTHMVRNSADHGLEMPDVRRAAGKPEVGRISLSAAHAGGHVVIELSDDGRGLDTPRIREKALARGLATAAELETMTDAQVHRFIFAAGFSTTEAVTSVSGRGVGMDVVRSNIERIGGSVAMTSAPDRGSRFTITIPLTLAIVSVLVVEAGGERFAVPQMSVVELVRARGATPVKVDASSGGPSSVKTSEGDGDAIIVWMDGVALLRLRDRLLPLVSLSHVLGLAPREARHDADGSARADTRVSVGDATHHVVVAQAGAGRFGILVDRVFDAEEIVVKPTAPMLRHIPLFSGNTILGDGTVIMILDPNGLSVAAGLRESEGQPAHGNGEPRASAASSANASHSDDRVPILLLRAGGVVRAVPLGLVSRLEQIAGSRIERIGSLTADQESPEGAGGGAARLATQYRGQLMPLLALSGRLDHAQESHAIVVFRQTDRPDAAALSVGLIVDEIVDVVTERLHIALGHAEAGLLGTAIVAGAAVGVIDTHHWLTRAHPGWFQQTERESGTQRRLLVVEDSSFFRQMLVPVLSTAGFTVTAASSALQALELRDTGSMFDVIVSDIEMPDMDGLAFARRLRASGPWQALPVIALSARTGPQDIDIAKKAGFSDYIRKFEKDALLASLQRALAGKDAATLAVAA